VALRLRQGLRLHNRKLQQMGKQKLPLPERNFPKRFKGFFSVLGRFRRTYLRQRLVAALKRYRHHLKNPIYNELTGNLWL
jgi:hypothetical protein